MATVVQDERGERVGKDISQRQNRVEDKEKAYLYAVLQEASHRGHRGVWVASASGAVQGGNGMAAGRLAMIGNLLIRAKRGLASIATLRYHSIESRKLLLLVLQKVLIT